MSDELFFNGIVKGSGRYAFASQKPAQLARSLVPLPQTPNEVTLLHRFLDWLKGIRLGLIEGVNPRNLSEAGWGVIFPERKQDYYSALLAPLLAMRRDQAGSLFKEMFVIENETTAEFLQRYSAWLPPVRPDQVPYYLLIAGTPQEIPLSFQYNLDVQYAVGRIAFSDDSSYRNFSRNVQDAETKLGQAGWRCNWFGPRHQGDPPTELSRRFLIEELEGSVAADYQNMESRVFSSEDCTKATLGQLLSGEDPPDFLFTAGHGVVLPHDSSDLQDWQGALVCGDWPGPQRPLYADQIFAARDLSGSGNGKGMAAFLFACFSGGSPARSDFPENPGSLGLPVAPEPFTARLPLTMLGRPGGCSAVVAHVESAFPWSFADDGNENQNQLFLDFFRKLGAGHRLGHALGAFHEAYADVRIKWEELQEKMRRLNGFQPNPLLLSTLWLRVNDTRNYVILGDPAVGVCRGD